MKKINTLTFISLSVILFSGCTAKLSPETQIPPEPKIEKTNYELSLVKQREIQKKYFEYQDSLVVGVITLTQNSIEKTKYYEELQTKDVDMSHEKIYDCKISKMFGKFPDRYFHNMLVVSNKRTVTKNVSIALNRNDVNDFIVYKDSYIYDDKDGGYGIAIVDFTNNDLDNVIAIRYKCEKIENILFKSENYRPIYE
jgi:hypothetical protein